MADGIISVIIPVYNTKPYLKQCVQSVLAQTYQALEIILVDDGSSDGSSEVCDELASANSEITAYHLKHRGVSAARNYAIERCHGKWVSFIDSDDWLDAKMYEAMVNALVRFNVDTVCCDCYDVCSECYKPRRIYDIPEKEKKITEKSKLLDCVAGRSGTLWNKLLSAQYVKAHRFREDIRYGEDSLFLTEYLLDTSSAFLINTPMYYYRSGRNGNVVSSKLDERSLELICTYGLIYDIMKENGAIAGGVLRVNVLAGEILSKIKTAQDITVNKKYLVALSRLFRRVSKDIGIFKNVGNISISRKRRLKWYVFGKEKLFILYLRININKARIKSGLHRNKSKNV